MTVEAIADLLEENSMAVTLDMEIIAMAVSVVEVLVVNSKKKYENNSTYYFHYTIIRNGYLGIQFQSR